MKVTLKRTELKAALLSASNDETRFMLNSVMVMVNPGFQPVLGSTNGRTMFLIESEAEQSKEDKPAEHDELVLHKDFVQGVVELMGKKKVETVTFEPISLTGKSFRDVRAEICSRDGEMSWVSRMMEGKYPALKQVIPDDKKGSLESFSVNASFFAVCNKACKILNPAHSYLDLKFIDHLSPVSVTSFAAKKFFALIMLARSSNENFEQPAFVKRIKNA